MKLYWGLARKKDLGEPEFINLIHNLKSINTGPYQGGWDDHWARRWEFPFVFGAINSFLETNNIKSPQILESGSGVNAFAFWLASKGYRVTGVDIDGSLKHGWEREDIPCRPDKSLTKFVEGDMLQLPFKDNHFDLAYSISAIEHTKDPKIAVKEMIRVVRPGGGLVFTMDIDIKNTDSVNPGDLSSILEILEKECIPNYPAMISPPQELLTFTGRTISPQPGWYISLKRLLGDLKLYRFRDQCIFIYTGHKKTLPD